MGILDWFIVGGLLLTLIVTALSTRKYTRSVADFLAANRCAGRYLLTVGSGVASLGAITIIAMCEMVYVGGLTNIWWSLGQGLIYAVVLVSGWIIYRFRQTRALTLAQFLEARYSRRFRIFSGIVCWISGIINFGIFPSVGARFFMAVLKIPGDAVWHGISVYALFLIVLIAVSFLFAVIGGQIAVMVTDFIQGAFMNIAIVVVVIAAIGVIGIPTITDTLMKGISLDNQRELDAAVSQVASGTPVEEISFKDNPKEKVLHDSLVFAIEQHEETSTADELSESALHYIQENDSMIHPFKIKGKKDLNIWFYLMSFWLMFYSARIWQGAQGYNAAAANPHEARMGNVLASLRVLPKTVFSVVLPLCALAWFSSDVAPDGLEELKAYMKQLGNANLERQNATPLSMMYFLPAGIKGTFVAIMLAAFISTHDTCIHSWGSILVQDVIMPFRKKPFSQKNHLILLRLSMLFVCLFIFAFSMIFRHTEYIVMFWNITGAIFTGGAGAVVIGGLYWKRGSTAAAWTSMITGSVLATGSVLLRQIHAADPFTNPILQFIASKNGMVLAFWSGVIAIAVYTVVSLLTSREPHNMDKLLHRGKYAVADDEHKEAQEPVRGLRALIGITDEFNKVDRFIYMICVGWMLLTVAVFVIGTAVNLTMDVSDEAWLTYWKWHIGIYIIGSAVVAVWFTIGGIRDLATLFKRLASIQRDEGDDGVVDP